MKKVNDLDAIMKELNKIKDTVSNSSQINILQIFKQIWQNFMKFFKNRIRYSKNEITRNYMNK